MQDNIESSAEPQQSNEDTIRIDNTTIPPPTQSNAAEVQPQLTAGKVSFRLTLQKKQELVLTGSGGKPVEEEDDITVSGQKRAIAYLEDGVICDDDSPHRKKEKRSYVIEIKRSTNDWRIERLKKIMDEGGATEEDKARLAVLIEAVGGETGVYGNGVENTNSSIIPPTIEGEEVDEADYEAIPIGEFGLAFLRGCGWKEEEGIGKTNKQAIKMEVSKPRPKGLGLGAEFKQKEADDPTTLKSKARVRILAGLNRNCTGQVISMDEETFSCFVKLDINGREIKIHQSKVEVVVDSAMRKNVEEHSSRNGNITNNKQDGYGLTAHGQPRGRDREEVVDRRSGRDEKRVSAEHRSNRSSNEYKRSKRH